MLQHKHNYEKKTIKIFDKHQYIIFNAKGILIASDNGLFETSSLSNKNIITSFPFIESIQGILEGLSLNDADLRFDRVESVFEGLSGFYDYIFRKIIFGNETVFYWQILDSTTRYKNFQKRQQSFQEKILNSKM